MGILKVIGILLVLIVILCIGLGISLVPSLTKQSDGFYRGSPTIVKWLGQTIPYDLTLSCLKPGDVNTDFLTQIGAPTIIAITDDMLLPQQMVCVSGSKTLNRTKDLVCC